VAATGRLGSRVHAAHIGTSRPGGRAAQGRSGPAEAMGRRRPQCIAGRPGSVPPLRHKLIRGGQGQCPHCDTSSSLAHIGRPGSVPPLRHKLIVSSYRGRPGSVPPLRHKLIVSSYRWRGAVWEARVSAPIATQAHR
jgi:hypothetical protein